MKKIVITSAARTAVGSLGGSLKNIPATDLGSVVINECIKKSSLKKQRSLLLAEDAENKVITETTNVWSKYQSSESVLKATEAQLKAAEIANEGITLEYDSGNTRTTLEVIQSRSLLLNSRIEFAKAERDFIISQFELSQQIGILTPNTLK